VRVYEPACPFCAASLAKAFGPPPAPRAGARLGRAALFALGSGAASLVGACEGTRVAFYGAPAYFEPLPDAGPRDDAASADAADDGDPGGGIDDADAADDADAKPDAFDAGDNDD
jgi:hypothetical protein